MKRPKAIIKDPKACQADGGSFVYRIRNGQIVDVGQSLLEQTVLFSCHIPFILFTWMLDGNKNLFLLLNGHFVTSKEESPKKLSSFGALKLAS